MTGSAIDIGSRLELFVDDYLIESMDGADLKLHKPVAREIARQHDKRHMRNLIHVERDADQPIAVCNRRDGVAGRGSHDGADGPDDQPL